RTWPIRRRHSELRCGALPPAAARERRYFPQDPDTTSVSYPAPHGGLVVAFRDIVDRKRSEEALRETEERFRTMLEAVLHIAFVIRPGGTAEFYNAMFRDYVGLPIGTDPASRLKLHHPNDQEGLARAREVGRSRGSEYTVEARIRRHDGAYRWHRI